MEFINSLPQDLSILPATYPKIFRNVNVLWRGHHDGHCILELRRDDSVPRKTKFVLSLMEQFMNGVDLRLSKRVAAYYRWNGVGLEIKLEQALSPDMDFQINTEVLLLAKKPKVTKKDIRERELLLPKTNLRQFYDTCNPQVRLWLDNQEWFSIQVYRPVGMMESVETEMRTQFGVSRVIEACSLLINITKIVENYGSSLQAGQELTVKYQCTIGLRGNLSWCSWRERKTPMLLLCF
jgi:hypothetical protein